MNEDFFSPAGVKVLQLLWVCDRKMGEKTWCKYCVRERVDFG